MIDDDDLELEEYMSKLKLADNSINDMGNYHQQQDMNSNLNMTFYAVEDHVDQNGFDDDEMEEMAKFRDAIASSTIQIPVELKKRFGSGIDSKSRRHLLFNQDGDSDQETERLPSLVTDSWLDITLNSSSMNSEHYAAGTGDIEGGPGSDVDVEGISNITWDKSWNEAEVGGYRENDCLATSNEIFKGQFAQDNNSDREASEVSISDHVNYIVHLMEQEKKIAELIPGAACQALQLENQTNEKTYGYFSHETRKSVCGQTYGELYGFIDKFGCITSFIIDTTFELHKQIITIGRSFMNDLRINDKHISRFVCEIELKVIDSATYAYLHCLEGNLNCIVLVDGELIQCKQTVPLRNYAHIEIGRYKFGYRHFSHDYTEFGPVTHMEKKGVEFGPYAYDNVD